MRLTTMTQVTIDGVMQGNGHATEEERADGFHRAGWAMGRFGETTVELITETYQRAAGFLFGRRTYEMFAETWGTLEDMREHPIGRALNAAPKYVATSTLTDATWANSTILTGDLEVAVRNLKEQPGGDLQVHGSGALIRWLLAHDLIDELTLLTVPVILGQGSRLFPAAGPDVQLSLLEARADEKGATVQVFRPAGRPEYRPNFDT
jgi:dihydrofolate reductase